MAISLVIFLYSRGHETLPTRFPYDVFVAFNIFQTVFACLTRQNSRK